MHREAAQVMEQLSGARSGFGRQSDVRVQASCHGPSTRNAPRYNGFRMSLLR